MEDPFLNYFALGMLLFVVIVLFYGIIAIHDIPARIAKQRHHPHEDAIHAAGWISLFMLHVLWPFLWIWAMTYRPERGWGFSHKPNEPTSPQEATAELGALRNRLGEIEASLGIEKPSTHFGKGQPSPGLGLPKPVVSAVEKKPVVSAVEKETVAAAGTAPAETKGAQR